MLLSLYFNSTSVYNLNEEEEDEEVPSKEKLEENSKMKEKLDQLRINMEKMNLTRKVCSTSQQPLISFSPFYCIFKTVKGAVLSNIGYQIHLSKLLIESL